MACELLTKEIANSKGEPIVFTTRQLPPTKALDLHVELIGKVGGTIFPLIDNTYKFGDIVTLMARAENKVLTELIKRVVCLANKDGVEIKPALFDITFEGELMLVFKVFAFVVEANFNDFFKQGLEINAQRKLEAAEISEAAPQESSSPKT